MWGAAVVMPAAPCFYLWLLIYTTAALLSAPGQAVLKSKNEMASVVSDPCGHYGRCFRRGHDLPLRLRCDPVSGPAAATGERRLRPRLGLHCRSEGRANLHQKAGSLIRGL